MSKKTAAIVDLGRGPQLAGSRLTVLDVYYYHRRGYDFEFIHQALPSLTREQYEAVVTYAAAHHEELEEKDRRAEEYHRQGIQTQRALGDTFGSTDENATTQERVARLRDKMQRRHVEQNGAATPR